MDADDRRSPELGGYADPRAPHPARDGWAEDPPPHADPGFPWPPPENASPVDHLVTTWRESVFRPRSFFAAMPRRPSVAAALAYYLILGVVGAAIQLFWRMIFVATLDPESPLLRALRMGGEGGSPLVEFLLAPVTLLVVFGLAAVIVHAALWLTGGARQGLRTTSAVLGYTSGPQLFTVVPLIGQMIAGIWALVLLVIGLREGHGTTTMRAVIAVLIPVFLAAGLMMLVMLALMATGVPGLPDLMG